MSSNGSAEGPGLGTGPTADGTGGGVRGHLQRDCGRGRRHPQRGRREAGGIIRSVAILAQGKFKLRWVQLWPS